MLGNLRIHWKLTLLSATFLAPIALLSWLFFDYCVKDIRFIARELDGSRYIAALRDVLEPLAAGRVQDAVDALELVERVHRSVGGPMNLGSDAEKVSTAVRQSAISSETASVTQLEAIATVRKLMDAVGDGSGLKLDTDLDSFHCIDMVVAFLPLATERTVTLINAIQSVLWMDGSTAVATLHLRIGEFGAILNDINQAFAGALHGNADGSVRNALAEPFRRYTQATQAYLKLADAIAVAATKGAVAPTMAAELPRMVAAVQDQGQALAIQTNREVDRLLSDRMAQNKDKLFWSFAVVGGVVILAMALALLIARAISRPVVYLVAAMKGMAAGDMTVVVPGRDRRDEAGLLAQAAGEMQQQLHALATEVRAHAAAVDAAAQRIAGLVDEQAASSKQLSFTVGEISSTMETLSAASSQISEHSEAVAAIADATWENSKSGLDAMRQVTIRMDGIHRENRKSLEDILDLGMTSKEIGKIMGIIGAIADQTKLIAINAALEAARAREAGHGFGVIATEVQRLADGVTDSLNDIEPKVNHIQETIHRLVETSEHGSAGIEAGITTTASTATRLSEVVDAAERTSAAARQISQSTQHQKTANTQVVAALREIVVASTQTTQSITSIAEISGDMAALSADLGTAISRFQLNT